MAAGIIVVGGAVAQKPHRGGHTWVFLQYLLGFQRLGWDVFLLDHLAPPASPGDDGPTYLRGVMERIGLGGAYAILTDEGEPLGLPRREIEARVRDAAFLLNVNGFIRDRSILEAARRRVFLDIDPGVGQMWKAAGLTDVFAGHDEFVTIGEHIGRDDCVIPTCGLPWIATRPPVVLERWPASRAANDTFTSVATWRGAYGPIEFNGRVYGHRAHEFRKFADIPRLTGRPFEVALNIHAADQRDITRLETGGWSLTDPAAVARDPWTYQTYIQNSASEFTVAKNLYVDTRCGWLSDRSVCYLASGKPVIAQDTGLASLYPTGEGLVTFSTLDEAVQAVGDVSARYAQHASAARALAAQHFDSDVVLTRLLAGLHVA